MFFLFLFVILLFLFKCQIKYNLYYDDIKIFNNYTDYLLNNKLYIIYNISETKKQKIYLTLKNQIFLNYYNNISFYNDHTIQTFYITNNYVYGIPIKLFNNITVIYFNESHKMNQNFSSIGLNFIDLDFNKVYNLIYQLKNLNLIKFYTFNVNLNKKIISFGDEYDQNNFIKSSYSNLKINVDEIYYNNIKDTEFYVFDKFIDFDFNLKGIFASTKFSDYIKEFFLNFTENKICEKIYQNNKFSYVCDEKKFTNKNFPTIYFNVKSLNYNFTLEKDDLFIKYENKIYCLIFFRFNSYSSSLWTLGEPFIKKYNFLVDLDRKILSFNLNNNENKNKINKNIFYYFLIFFLICIIIILIFLLFKIYNNRYKKFKGLELEYYPIEK